MNMAFGASRHLRHDDPPTRQPRVATISHRLARRKVTAVLRGLPRLSGANRTSPASLCTTLAAHRGRPIRLEPLGGSTGGQRSVSGVLLVLANEDLILFDPSSSPMHRWSCVMHEVGHLLLGHATSIRGCGDDGAATPLAMPEPLLKLMPQLSPDLIRRVLATPVYRTVFADDQREIEAEMFASTAWQLGLGPGARTRGASDDRELAADDEQVVRRLADCLGTTRP